MSFPASGLDDVGIDNPKLFARTVCMCPGKQARAIFLRLDFSFIFRTFSYTKSSYNFSPLLDRCWIGILFRQEHITILDSECLGHCSAELGVYIKLSGAYRGYVRLGHKVNTPLTLDK